MNITWKTLPIVAVVLASIGYRVYNRAPGYRTLGEESVVIPSEQAYVYSLEAVQAVKMRISFKADSNITAYLATERAHNGIQNGTIESADGITMLTPSAMAMQDQEASLTPGNSFIYFEPIGSDADVHVSYKVEAYKK